MARKSTRNHRYTKKLFLWITVSVVILLIGFMILYLPKYQKAQSFKAFYNRLSQAENNKDWSTLYDLTTPSLRNNVTKENYIKSLNKTNNFYSQTTTIHSITIKENTAIINRTKITCLTVGCTGSNRVEDTAERTFNYINESWHVPDLPQPSERALSVITYIIYNTNFSETQLQQFADTWGMGSIPFGITNFARMLDNDSQKLVALEQTVEQIKSNRNRPVYIQQPAPIIMPAPIIQQPLYNPSIHCTTNTIGSSTYTNCY